MAADHRSPDAEPRTVSLADEEDVKRILIDTLFGPWPLCVDGADEAIAIVRERHGRWAAAQDSPSQPGPRTQR